MEQHYFKTAEFAALCGVKKDTLFHYDRIGLLKPQKVGENGYRYYSVRQLATYDLIDTLRRLGTPLAEIRDYLTRRSPEAMLEILEEKEQALEAERKRLARMGSLLREAIAGVRLAQEVQLGEIRMEEREEARYVVTRAPDFTRFEEATYLIHTRKLLSQVREQGGLPAAPGDIVCRESLERDSFLEDYYYCPAPEGTEEENLYVRPAGTYAVLYHQGTYQSEYEACRRLRDWALKRGYEIDGDLYEEDLVNYTTSEDPEAYLLRLSLKVRKPEK